MAILNSELKEKQLHELWVIHTFEAATAAQWGVRFPPVKDQNEFA